MNTLREYSFREIKEISKEKSNSTIQNATKTFLKEGLITERKIGTSKLYSVNQGNKKIYSYFDIFIQENLPKTVQKSIEILKKEIERHTYFYSIAIFGSYAEGKQKKDSDLDIAVFIEQEERRKIIEAALKSAKDKSIINLDGHAITKSEFLEMLKVDYANLGKEIAKKHLIIHNPLIFYSILNEGVKNGFRL